MDHSQTLNPAGLEPTRATARSGAWAQALKSPLLLGLLVLLGVQILAAIGLSLGGRDSLTPAPLDSLLLPCCHAGPPSPSHPAPKRGKRS